MSSPFPDSTASTPTPQGKTWERSLIESAAQQWFAEQRAKRRANLFFRFIWLAFFLLIFAAIMGWISRPKTDDLKPMGSMSLGGKHTAVIDIAGVIASNSPASGERIIAGLNAAFRDPNTAGIILRVNSPGGSPVQAGQVVDEMRRLKTKYPDVPIIAVVEDLCASGGYYIAAAADKVFVDKASLVGSIGVIMGGYGYTELMQKIGVERRVFTAGENKAFLDGSAPLNPAHVAHINTLLTGIHEQFIDVVRTGRGKRLKETPDMFSGLIWTGKQAIDLGLVDAIGSVSTVAREVIKAERTTDFSQSEDPWEKITRRFGVMVGDGFGRGASESFGLSNKTTVR